MTVPRPNRLAIAHAELRNLRNRIHEVEQGHLPLRSQIQGLEQDLKRVTHRYEAAERRANACQRAFDAIVTALHELRVASGKEST